LFSGASGGSNPQIKAALANFGERADCEPGTAGAWPEFELAGSCTETGGVVEKLIAAIAGVAAGSETKLRSQE
jgi:hypothetical protein